MNDLQEHQEIVVDLVEEGEDAGEVAVDAGEVEEAVVVRWCFTLYHAFLNQSLQVVVVVEVSKVVVGEVEIAAVGVEVVGVVAVVVEAPAVEPGAVRRSFSNLIDIQVSSSLRGKTIYLSRRTLSQEKVFMVKNGYPLKVASTTQRSSIAYGILSGVSWQQVYWAVWIRFLLNPEGRFCTSVLLAARV
jgi:hypothetical protein